MDAAALAAAERDIWLGLSSYNDKQLSFFQFSDIL